MLEYIIGAVIAIASLVIGGVLGSYSRLQYGVAIGATIMGVVGIFVAFVVSKILNDFRKRR